jgi:hypothetical protein
MSSCQAYGRRASTLVVWLRRSIVELEVAVLVILSAQQKKAVKVSILRFPIWLGLLIYTIPDPIMLNDDESMGAESETDYGGLDVGLRTRSDSDSLYVTDNKPADGDSISLRTIHTSGRLAADHPDDGNKNNNGLVNDTQLRLSANRPGSASPGHRSAIYQASKLRINTDITQGNTNYVNLDVTKELKEGEFSVFAKKRDEDDNDTYSMKRSKSSTVSGDDPAFDGNMSKLQDDLPDHAQSLQPGPAATSLHQSDLKDHLQEQLRRSPTGNVGRKRPYMTAPIRLANTASTVSAALGSADLEEAQPNALTAAPVEDQERELRDINLEMVNDRDYTNKSDAAGSQIGGRPRSRKRVRRTKDTEDDDVAAPSTHSLDASYQAAAVTSSDGIHESEEIPIHGYLTLKTIKSKVVYCLTFSQEVLPHTRDRGQRQDIAKSVSSSSNRRDLERSPVQKRALNRPVRNSPFSPEDDELLLQLKGDGFSWDEISKRFPERSKGTLQVHYSTKLKRRLETCKMTRKPRRDG